MSTHENEKLVFVYGTLKEDGAFHFVMERYDVTKVGKASILNKNFVMRDLGGIPAACHVDAGSGTYIRGELYLVSPECLAAIDRVEGYPVTYQRELVDVWTDGGTTLKAYVYTRDDKTGPVIQSGSWDVHLNEGVPSKDFDDAVFKGEEVDDEVPFEDNIEGTYDGPTFTVERGVFITTDWGEHYGPYYTIQDAVQAVPHVAACIGTDIRTLTIGFRLVNDYLSKEDLTEIEKETCLV